MSMLLAVARQAWAAEGQSAGEMQLVLPNFSSVYFLGMTGQTLLTGGLLVCALGFGFGIMIYQQLRTLPVHKAMR